MHHFSDFLLIVLIVCLGLKMQVSTATSHILSGFQRLCGQCGGFMRARMHKKHLKLNPNKTLYTWKKLSTLSTLSTHSHITNINHIVSLLIVALTTINIVSTR